MAEFANSYLDCRELNLRCKSHASCSLIVKSRTSVCDAMAEAN